MAKRSLWLSSWVVGTRGREGTSLRHGYVAVSVGSLRAETLIEAVDGCVRLEFSVHVPAELLSCRLRVVVLFLWLPFKRLQLLLKDSQVLLVVTGGLGGCRPWVALSRLLRNRNHYKGQKRRYFCNDSGGRTSCDGREDVGEEDVALTILGVEVELLLEDAAFVLFSDSFDPACVDLREGTG